MTAQVTNDGMNLDYPGKTSTPPVAPVFTTPAPSQPVTVDPQSPFQNSQNNVSAFPNTGDAQVSGPAFDVLPATPLPEMSVAEPVNEVSNPMVTNSVPQFDPSTVVPPVSQVTEPAVQEEEKESPLQALARKLAELKSELVEETPAAEETNATVTLSDTSVEQLQPATPVDLPLPQAFETPSTPQFPLPEVSQNQNITASEPVPNPFNQSASVEEPVQESLVPTQTIEEIPVQISAPVETVTEPTIEEIAKSTIPAPEMIMDPIALGTVEESPKPVDLSQSFEQVAPSEAETPSEPAIVQEQPMDAVNTVTPPVPTATPVDFQAADMDENDLSAVNTEELVQETSTKFPLSISKILDAAIERNASDVHISVGYPVMIRIDGTLIALHDQIVTAENTEELILPVLSDQKKELLEVNREVDLAYTHRHGGEARFRINAFYTRENLSAAFRLIPTRIRSIEELKLPPIYTQFAGLKQGLVLVTGPTGHGKSTTLAAILQHINMNRAVHVLTIEDPIEYIFPKARAVIDQREMHDDTHSWNVALKSALRQDPDVILVGEMRDYETIASTITLAETGHLVFATLHTNSASQTIDRIIDVFPENQQAQVRAQLANILEAVVAQRLIPVEGGGRRAVSEIMLGTPAVRNMIREGKTHQLDNVIRTSADVGMVPLEHSLVRLVREGMITMDKAEEYAVHPEEVVRLLKS